jgi:hypothetical protein
MWIGYEITGDARWEADTERYSSVSYCLISLKAAGRSGQKLLKLKAQK